MQTFSHRGKTRHTDRAGRITVAGRAYWPLGLVPAYLDPGRGGLGRIGDVFGGVADLLGPEPGSSPTSGTCFGACCFPWAPTSDLKPATSTWAPLLKKPMTTLTTDEHIFHCSAFQSSSAAP